MSVQVKSARLPRFSATSSIVNKQKFGGIGFVAAELYMNGGAGALQLLNATNAVTMSGKKRAVTSLTGATSAPAATASGTLYLCNRAGGITVTLPAPVVGAWFEYFVLTAFTGTFEVDTDAGTTFLVGTIDSGVEATTPAANPGPKYFSADGTTIVKYKADADTKGRLQGTRLVFTCVTTTQWLVAGHAQCSGTIATPFA